MGSGGTTALLPPDKFFSNLPNFNLKSGADTQSRTGDLTLTKGALYQLSHISTAKGKRIHTRAIHSIDTDIKLNRALWVMTETLLENMR